MARVPTKAEIAYIKSDDPSKYDVSKFKNTKYTYNFPYTTNANLNRQYGVHDLYIYNRLPFISLLSSKMLSKKESYMKLSVSLALLALFENEGFTSRPISAIGGYNNGVIDEVYIENTYPDEIQGYIDRLYKSNNSFQIQSRFTISRALAIMWDPESATIEFFKVIELYIKNCAYTGLFSDATARKVLADRPNPFTKEVKDELINKKLLDMNTVEVIFKLRDIRNRFIGHGGVRPVVAGIFGDPENNKIKINCPEFQYDDMFTFGEPFYEKVMYDIEVIAVLLFCKLNNIKPVHLNIPGCWWQPSKVIQDIINKENMSIIQIYPSLLDPANSK